MIQQTEGELAVQAVNKSRWAVVSTPSSRSTSSLASAAPPTAANQVFGDEGVAAELQRQQQFRQQRAVPIASEACRRILISELPRVSDYLHI